MTPRRRPRRILVADDDAHVLDAYRRVLEGPTEAADASSAASAMDALSRELFSDAAAAAPAGLVEEIVYCRQGEEAVRAVETAIGEGRPFGVVFLDMRMPPGIDGLEAARRIRAIDAHVNVVVVTGYSDHRPADIAAVVGGARHVFYIVKPFDADELRQMASALSERWSSDLGLAEELARRIAELEALNAALAASEARARELARRDPLTRLLNRMAFTECFAEEEEAARAGLRRPTLLYLDLDRLKCVNDTLGHAAGDALIVEFARRLQAAAAGRGVVARLGGDEFAVICPDPAAAEAVARDVLAAARHPCGFGSRRIETTVSIGLAVADGETPRMDEAMRRADVALYAAKAAGRGRLVTYAAGMEDPVSRTG